MKRPRPPSRIGRKRRTLGWTLLTVGVIVAGVWVWSGWGTRTYMLRDGIIEVSSGEIVRVDLLRDRVPPHALETLVEIRNYIRESHDRNVGGIFNRWHYLRIGIAVQGFTSKETTFPLWPIPLLLWIPAALLLRSGILARRRAMSNTCTKCGYSLAGLGADTPCPECGKGAKITT